MEYFFTAFITLISAVLGLVFSIGAVKKETTNSRTSAFYMLARSFALVFIAMIPIYCRAEKILVVITITMLHVY